MPASKNGMLRSFFRYRQFRALSVVAGWLLLGIALLSPGSAWGENLRQESASGTTIYYDTNDPNELKNPTDSDVWGSSGWPSELANTYAHPYDSLFPILSGSHNTVTVDGVEIPRTPTNNNGPGKGYVLGGLWQGADADGVVRSAYNVVTVQNGAIVGKIYGGAALGTASYNTVYLLGSGTRAEQVTGGMSVAKTSGNSASYNRVFITDATASGIVSGGWNGSGDPGDGTGQSGNQTSQSDNDVFVNTVRIDGSASVTANIYGGYNEGNSKTYGNRVTIASGTMKPDLQIVGGYSSVTGTSGTTKVYGNTVTVTGGNITLKSGGYNGIYGGRSQGGSTDVYENTVVIAGGNILKTGDGGVVSGGSGGKSGSGASQVYSNEVYITAGAVDNKVAGGRIADAGTARDNKVTLTGGTVTGDIYGAYDSSAASLATIRNNLVNLSGGTAANVYGGYSYDGENKENTVALAAAKVTGNLYAGFNAGTENELVTNNAVTLLGGGTVEGTVYGTSYSSDTKWQGHGNHLQALGGLTNVGGIDRFATAVLQPGAQVNVTGGGRLQTVFNALRNDGLLSFYNGTHNTGRTDSDTENNPDIGAFNTEAATIQGAYSGGGALGLEISFDKGANPAVSDRVVFEQTPSTLVVFHFESLPDSVIAPYADNKPNSEFAVVPAGETLAFTAAEPGYGIYAYTFEQRGRSLFVGFTDAHTGDLGRGPTDSSGASLGQVAVMSESFLRDNVDAALPEDGGWGIAVNTGYSWQRFHGGNDIDVEGLAALVTLSYHRKGSPFAAGVFADMFHGKYKTHNSVSLPFGHYGIESTGDVESYGGGVSFQYRERLDEAIAAGGFAAWTPGPYVKALIRAGYNSMDHTDDTYYASVFEVDGLYYGATLGGGYVFEPNPRLVVDLYGYGAYTALSERETIDSLGQDIDFAGVDSLRFISGFRTAWKATERVLPYAGLALEWETLGRPEARINGYQADSADLSGVSGLIELGVNSKVGEKLFLDVKLTGSVGQREGIGGMLELRYSF